MTNQALPRQSREMLERHLDDCCNLGLILDKFAPWGQDQRGNWDLTMESTVRRGGKNEVQALSGGEAKGLWLSTKRRANHGESPSLFEVSRTDMALMRKAQERWIAIVKSASGIGFTMSTSERLAAGLGASHVLETSLTLERNTGLPYLPGSTVKGLARAWGLIEVAAKLDISLEDVDNKNQSLVNTVAELLISEPDETLLQSLHQLCSVSEDAEAYIQWFRLIFGSQMNAAAVCFLDAIYYGEDEPKYAADVMTPHYVNYYTESGGKPPTEDDNPNPVSFLTVDMGNTFAFGLIPRKAAFANLRPQDQTIALNTAADWLGKSLVQMGAGSKTAAGYGFFNRRSQNFLFGQ